MGRSTEPEVSGEVLTLLQQYPWPGNIRELRNVVERAVLLCRGDVLELSHLPADKMSSHFAARKTAHAPTVATPPFVALPTPSIVLAPALLLVVLRETLSMTWRQRNYG